MPDLNRRPAAGLAVRFEALFSGRFFYDSFPAAFRLVLTSVLADVVTSVQDPDPRGHILRGLAGRDPGVNSAFKNDEFCIQIQGILHHK